MTRKMLSGLAAIAALAVLTSAFAHSQPLKRQGVGGNGNAQPVQQGSQQLSGNQHNSADISTYMGAYAYQIARKCLDNMMPECPKKK